MTAAGINVPKGFVITAEAYREFLKENKIDEIISRIFVEKQTDEQALLSAAGEFRKKIIAGHFPAQLEKKIREKYAELGDDGLGDPTQLEGGRALFAYPGRRAQRQAWLLVVRRTTRHRSRLAREKRFLHRCLLI